MKKENPRMDIVSRNRYPKDRLFRFVLRDGFIRLEENEGRGFYLLKDPSSVEAFFKKKPYLRHGRFEDEAAMKETLLRRIPQ